MKKYLKTLFNDRGFNTVLLHNQFNSFPHHVLFSACKFFEVISKAITPYQKFNFRV